MVSARINRLLVGGAILAASGVMVGAGQAQATASTRSRKPPLQSCGPAWTGLQVQSEACAMFYVQGRQVNVQCFVEYGFSGATTQIFECGVEEGTGTSCETLVTNISGTYSTPMANAGYGYAPLGVRRQKRHTYRADFVFQASNGSAKGPVETYSTPCRKG
jgi:hypothetical protein